MAGNKRIHVQGTDGEVTLDPATDYYVRNLWVETDAGTREIVVPNPNQFAAMLDEMALAAPRRPRAEDAGGRGAPRRPDYASDLPGRRD